MVQLIAAKSTHKSHLEDFLVLAPILALMPTLVVRQSLHPPLTLLLRTWGDQNLDGSIF